MEDPDAADRPQEPVENMMVEEEGQESNDNSNDNVPVANQEEQQQGNDEEQETGEASSVRDVLPYESWAAAVAMGGGRVVEDPLPENVVHVMTQVFSNDMLVENILEKIIFSKDRPAIRSCRLVSRQWVCSISKLYKRMKKPLFLVNTNKDLFPHNDPPRPIFDHHSVVSEFLRSMIRPVRIEGFIPTFALHLAPHYFRKCNYTDFVNCLVQCGPSLVELRVTFPKNSFMSFLLPSGIHLPNLITMGVCFSAVTLHTSLYAGPFQHQHEYLPNYSSIHLVQTILNCAGKLRNFHFMPCQNPNNPLDIEHLYLPDKLVSLKVETPLRGFELLLRKHFENLTEFTLNPSFVLYSEGEVFELLSKLSSTLRVLNLAGNTNHSYKHSLPVKLPRMEALTKFAMFKPWEFEVRNPPLSFEEILPKIETLVFATQTEQSFSYLMSGMRSTTVTAFSVWLTSLGSYRQPQMVGGVPQVAGIVNLMEPNRLIQVGGPHPHPFMGRFGAGAHVDHQIDMDLDLMPGRAPGRQLRALRGARRYFLDRREGRLNLRHDNADDDVRGRRMNMHEVLLQPPRVVVGGGGPRDRERLGDPAPAVRGDERERQREEEQLLRRRLRLRAYNEIHLQRRLQQQHLQRRREAGIGERDVEPRVLELRRRLNEIRGRLDGEDRHRVPERWRRLRGNLNQGAELPEPEIRIEVVRNQNEPEEEAPAAPRRRPIIIPQAPRMIEDIVDEMLLSSSDSDGEEEDEDDDDDEEEDLMEGRMHPAAEPDDDVGGVRMRPLQVLAAAAVAEENMGRIHERVRALEHNLNNVDDVPEQDPPPGGNEIPIHHHLDDQGNNANNRPAPVRSCRILERIENAAGGANNNGNNRAEPQPLDNVQALRVINVMNDVMRNFQGRHNDPIRGDPRVVQNEPNPNLHVLALPLPVPAVHDAPAAPPPPARPEEDLPPQPVDADADPRIRAMRHLHNQLMEQYRRHRPGRQQFPHHHHHLLPERPVTMTVEKMQQINVAFINLTKLKINICGPEVCGLKYLFEEMKSLQLLKIVVEKSLWPIKWDSVLTGIPTEFCEAVKSSTELWDEVYLHENQVSIRSLTKLEELGILECLKVNEQVRQDGTGEEHLISDVAFHFALLKMKNLKHLAVTPGFSPSASMVQKWYQEKGYHIQMKAVGRMEAEYEET